MSNIRDNRETWLQYLSDEDLSFLKRFVLASGSLKKVASSYGISYPTIRLRLDRLINKIEVVDQQNEISEFERLARAQYADGKLDLETLRLLLKAHREALEQSHGDSSTG